MDNRLFTCSMLWYFCAFPILPIASLAVPQSKDVSSSALLTDTAKRFVRAEESDPLPLQQKPRGDPREYQYAVLSNGLQVVNIFDPNSTQAAVSVAASVGSLSDPKGFDGLAHLTEHAMFLGSEKFPEQSGFDVWLAERGGFSNAYTAEEQTVYYVALNEEDFEACLDRYSDVFTAPLFEASWIWDEVSAVDSEHNKNRNSQDWRLQELIRHHADERSPMHRFHTGSRASRATLQRTSKETLAAEIQAFFAANYCPPRLRLVTFGPRPVQWQLEKARAFFERIPRAGRAGRCAAEAPSFANPPPFPNSTLGTMLRMEGLATQAELHLVFPMRNLQPWVRSRPMAYLDHIVNYGGPGSLVVALRDELGLASDVSVDSQDLSAGSQIEIAMSLLPEGVDKLPVALDACFAFLQRALQSPSQEKASLLASLAESSRLGYDWSGLPDSSTAVSNMADSMTLLGPSDLMVSGRLILEPDVEKVDYILERLRPENMILILVDAEGSEFWRAPPSDARVLPYYDVRYTARLLDAALPSWHLPSSRAATMSSELPLSLDQRVAEVSPEAALGLTVPGAVRGLPQISPVFHRASVADGDVLAKLWGQPPTRQGDGEPEVWFREGWMLQSPHIISELSLRRPQGEESDKAVDAVTLEVGLRMLGELMDLRLANVSATGTSWKAAIGPSGFALRLGSYASNAASSFEQVLDQLTGAEEAGPAAARRMKRVSTDFEQELRDQTEAVLKVAVREREILLTPGSHSRTELLEALKGTRLSASQSAAALRAAREGRLSASLLVMGSCTKEEAVALQATICNKLGVQSSKVQLLPSNASERVRRVVRPAAPVELRARSPRNDSTHAMLMTILVGTGSLRERVLLGLVSQVLQEVAFAELRTRLQLGYTVGGTVSAISNVLTVSCYVQSEVALPDVAEAYCEKVLSTDVPAALENLSSDAFASMKEAFRLALLQPPLSAAEEMDRFWAPIQLGKCFTVSEQMLTYLKTVEKQDILAAWKHAVEPKVRAKIVIKLFGDGRDPGELSTDQAAKQLQKVGGNSAASRRVERERHLATVLHGLANSSLRQQLLAAPGAGYFPQTLRCDIAAGPEDAEDTEEDSAEESPPESTSLMRRAAEAPAAPRPETS